MMKLPNKLLGDDPTRIVLYNFEHIAAPPAGGDGDDNGNDSDNDRDAARRPPSGGSVDSFDEATGEAIGESCYEANILAGTAPGNCRRSTLGAASLVNPWTVEVREMTYHARTRMTSSRHHDEHKGDLVSSPRQTQG